MSVYLSPKFESYNVNGSCGLPYDPDASKSSLRLLKLIIGIEFAHGE